MLYDITKVAINNDKIVVLKVTGTQMDLIAEGYHGNETMFSVTKGYEPVYKIHRDNGKVVSWNNRTLVTERVTEIGKEIRDAVKKHGISLNTPMWGY